MAVKMRIEGGGDIERALAKLARGTSKGVTRRAMKKALKPIAETAEGNCGGKFKVVVTSKLDQTAPREDRGRSKVTMYVGPDAKEDPHAHLYEDGTVQRFHKTGKSVGVMPAQPFMRPAWDSHQAEVLKTFGQEIWTEIEKTMERARLKAEKANGA